MKNNRGATLLTMGIAVAIMLIITSVIVFNAVSRTSTQKLSALYNDLTILTDKVNLYYWKYGQLPISREYTQISQIPTDVINPNDSGKYYVIDISALENLSLNTVMEENSLYIINEETHTIYYPAGVEAEGVTYYRLPEEYTKLNLEG